MQLKDVVVDGSDRLRNYFVILFAYLTDLIVTSIGL